ncbi:uncharacterized protein E0L32_006654 [Thyridium curvatum]|uniref:Zn(2)-C6 fungal-type domain-containing protein n=1 Tax=Thyridium curvatum TaxID=1093900 RepID=A0A507B6K0_9PEZI|nr:uncharacterized protein E0L32_006654 [Thyridium curvatum]TPX13009.1 hypothetical protein E0L32_006654 [Thyridium curvatum]
MASYERRSAVCIRCSEIKQGCRGGIPCERCTRLSLPCRPRNSSDSPPCRDNSLTIGNEPAQQPKARIRRVQTGCLTCKKRKKKCDERKPQCGDCRRLCMECTWPTEKALAKKSNDWVHEAWPGVRSVTSVTPPSLPISRSRSISRSDGSSSTSNLDFNIADALCQMSSTADTTVASEAGQPQDLGDMSVTAAPLQDLAWSLASDSTWLDILPQTPSIVSAPSPPESMSLPHPSLCLYTPSIVPDLTSPYDKALLNHYSTIVAPVLSRSPNPDANPYLGHLLPMALSNQLVLHCVLALSATHWQRLQPRMRDRALFHQGRATQSLARLLSHVDANLDIALVSCLLLCMAELFDGTSSGWELHLQGAKRMFTTLRRRQKADQLQRGSSNSGKQLAGGHYKFLVVLTRFLDSAATTSTCKPPLIDERCAPADSTSPVMDFSSSTSGGPSSSSGPSSGSGGRGESSGAGEDAAVYGIPKELFHLVDRVNELASKRGTRVDEASEAAFRREAARVRSQLDNWAYDYGGISGAVASLSGGSGNGRSNDDCLHATTAYEWALRLRLHQITEGYSIRDRAVAECVEHILASAQRVRYGSPLESCLLFPLVMAGGACDGLEQRMVIQDRLMVMERTCGFGYIHQSRELVETVWSRRDGAATGEARVNWARIRYEEMGGLALF